MARDISIRTVGPPQRGFLTEMYERFEPLGAALGLPPPSEEARRDWVEAAMSHRINLAAFAPSGAAVGHCFLVDSTDGSAELAIFVHQEFRRRGIATALVKAALARGYVAGLRRVWSLTGSENTSALRLQERFGFRVTNSAFYGTEMEIHLPFPDVRIALQAEPGFTNNQQVRTQWMDFMYRPTRVDPEVQGRRSPGRRRWHRSKSERACSPPVGFC